MRQLRLLRGAVAIAAMSAVLVAGASGSPGSRLTGDACAGRWRVVATGAKVPSLNEVAAISPTNVWAVGGSNEDAETAMPVIVHWDGKRLRSYRGFKPSGRYGELNAISAVAPDDVWAVGVDGQFRGRPVVMHWNGRAWKRTATPRVRGDARLNGIAAMSSSDVWAVGWDQNGALVMHWNGRAWSLVDLPSFVGPPPFVGSNTSLSAVDGSSPHDVWAVGGVGGENFGASFSLHWDGRSWKQMTALSPPCIECGDDVWQVASPFVVYEPVEVFRRCCGARAVGERGAAAAGSGDS